MLGILGLAMLACVTPVSLTTGNQSLLTEYPALSAYPAQSVDERNILELLAAYENVRNSYRPAEALSLYLPGALIKAGVKDDWTERIVPLEEYAMILTEDLENRRLYSLTLKLFIPSEVKIEGDTANVTIPFIIYSIPQHYWEKGVFHFGLKKTASGWLISRDTWELLDLHYIP